MTLWNKIEKENESLTKNIKSVFKYLFFIIVIKTNNKIGQIEIEIEKYNRELTHLEFQCQNMEKVFQKDSKNI